MNESSDRFPDGTWFVVPLRDGGFCRGLLAKANTKGVAFGYFFGPKNDTPSKLPPVAELRPCDAILIGRFGDLGLLSGEWRITDRDAQWDRDAWPMPPFVRLNEEDGIAMKAVYNDDLEILSEEPCDPSLAAEFPKDSLMGYGFVELKLTRLLGNRPK
jgi:hypothetical protein